jgi:hypothetical protein
MATRKTAAKTPAAKATKTAAKKAQSKAPPAAPKRPAPAAPTMPRSSAGAKPAALPAPAETPKQVGRIEAPTGEARYRWIAHAAYLRAEKRGFAPGQEIDDWLAAEAEFLAAHGIG